MKPLFVSKDILVRRTYRENKGFRFAGAMVILGLVAQLGVAFLALRNAAEKSNLESQARVLQAEYVAATNERQKVSVLENQLSQLNAWDPILRARLPTSALLANIEQAIPTQLVVSRLNLVSTISNRVKLKGGLYDMPEVYRLTIEGQQRGIDPQPIARFSQAILAKIPPGSKELVKKLNEPDSNGVSQFKLIFELPADGNYYNLGITKIQQPESL